MAFITPPLLNTYKTADGEGKNWFEPTGAEKLIVFLLHWPTGGKLLFAPRTIPVVRKKRKKRKKRWSMC